MARYVRGTDSTSIRADWFNDDNPLLPPLSVADHDTKDTGLVWRDGKPIMRAPNPIGFGRNEEW